MERKCTCKAHAQFPLPLPSTPELPSPSRAIAVPLPSPSSHRPSPVAVHERRGRRSSREEVVFDLQQDPDEASSDASSAEKSEGLLQRLQPDADAFFDFTILSLPRKNPTRPPSSSFCAAQWWAASLAPMWVRTRQASALARRARKTLRTRSTEMRLARAAEELVEGGVQTGIHLGQAVGMGGALLAAFHDVFGSVGLLADAGVDDDFKQELVLGEAELLVPLHDLAAEVGGDLSVVGGLEADVVKKVAVVAAPSEKDGPGKSREGV